MVKVWDAARGLQRFVFGGFTREKLRGVAFSPDGQSLIAWDPLNRVTAMSTRDSQRFFPRQPLPLPTPGPVTSPDGFFRAELRGPVVDVTDLRVSNPNANVWPLPSADVRRWHHAAQADDAKKVKHWFAAAFHQGKVADCIPWDAQARLDEASYWAQAEQKERAALAYVRALVTNPAGR